MIRVYVSVIIQNSEKQFLILKRAETARFAPGQWEFVNGTIDGKETAEETAIRELKEETGILTDKNDLKAWPIHELDDSDGHWVVIPFHVLSDREVKLSTEHTNYKWVTEEKLKAIPYVGEDFIVLQNKVNNG